LFDTASCNFGMCIFITGEVHDYWQYPQKFLDQFDAIITTRADIRHKKLIPSHHLCVWHVKKSYDFLSELEGIQKTKLISTITSTANLTDLHKQRVDFIQYIRDSSEFSLDWFGKGIREIDDKWDGLSSYKYSIAIENSSYSGYFTEKIIDCFLSFTIPVYFGCPDILRFFPENSLILIDPSDKKQSLDIIRDAINSDFYERNFDALLEARSRVLRQVGFFPSLINILSNNFEFSTGKRKRILLSNPMLHGKLTSKQWLYREKERVLRYFNGYR